MWKYRLIRERGDLLNIYLLSRNHIEEEELEEEMIDGREKLKQKMEG